MYIEVSSLIMLALIIFEGIYMLVKYLQNEQRRKVEKEYKDKIEALTPEPTPEDIRRALQKALETPPHLQDSVNLLKRLLDERNITYDDEGDIIWYFDEDLPLKEMTEEYANKVIDNFLEAIKNAEN